MHLLEDRFTWQIVGSRSVEKICIKNNLHLSKLTDFPSCIEKSRIFMHSTRSTSLLERKFFCKACILSLSCPPLYIIEIWCACVECPVTLNIFSSVFTACPSHSSTLLYCQGICILNRSTTYELKKVQDSSFT